MRSKIDSRMRTRQPQRRSNARHQRRRAVSSPGARSQRSDFDLGIRFLSNAGDAPSIGGNLCKMQAECNLFALTYGATRDLTVLTSAKYRDPLNLDQHLRTCETSDGNQRTCRKIITEDLLS